jgi:Putative auto-transporter adhesin, head GIN domain
MLLYYSDNTHRRLIMRKTLILLPMLALAGCNVLAESSNKEWSNAKAIPANDTVIAAFQSLEAAGPDNVKFVTGEGYRISATGDAKILEKLRYRLENGVLMVGRKGSSWQMGSSDSAATITITAPSINGLSLAGSGDINADNLQGDAVKLELAGSGNINVAAVTAKRIKSELAGSGDIVLAGKVENGEYEIAGSGTINAIKLAHADAKVSIAGSGDVSLTATGNVAADIVGSGDVNVTGGAKCTVSKTGSGSLNCS